MENMTIGAKRYGINTIHVTHKTIGSDRPWSLHVRTRRFRATEVLRRPEQIRIQLGWLFVAGIILDVDGVLSTWFHLAHY